MPILNSQAEKEVIQRVTEFVESEGFNQNEFSVFITHGQNLQIWLDKDFKEPKEEMKEIGEEVKHILSEEFSFNFDLINWGYRNIGFMLEVDQCKHAEYLKQKGF